MLIFLQIIEMQPQKENKRLCNFNLKMFLSDYCLRLCRSFSLNFFKDNFTMTCAQLAGRFMSANKYSQQDVSRQLINSKVFEQYGKPKPQLFSKQKQPPEVFYKKDGVKNFVKFALKHLCQSLFFNKVAGLRPVTLLKKRLRQRVLLTKMVRQRFELESR